LHPCNNCITSNSLMGRMLRHGFSVTFLLLVKVTPAATLRLSTDFGGDSAHGKDSEKHPIAFCLRGESFRSQYVSKSKGARAQVGRHKRSTCERDALENQQTLTSSHLKSFKMMEKKGFKVDLFGATYECQNGLNYVSNLTNMYSPYMQQLDILAKKGSSQLSTMAHVLRQAMNHGVDYEYYVLGRWDSWDAGHLPALTEQCFPGSVPRDLAFVRPGNSDSLFVVPAKHAKQFLAFMDEGSKPDGCCDGHCPMGCHDCALNYYIRINGIDDKGSQDSMQNLAREEKKRALSKEFRDDKSPCPNQVDFLKSNANQLEYEDSPAEDDFDDAECIEKMYPDDIDDYDFIKTVIKQR